MRKIVIQISVMVFIAGCLSPIDRFAGYIGNQIVISGQISTLTESSAVYVGRTSSIERLPEPVLDATVIMSDDQGNSYSFIQDFETPGKYILADVPGKSGTSYRLHVSLADGRQYVSATEKLPPAPGTDEVYYSIESDEYIDGDGIIAQRDFVKIYTNHTLPETSEPVFMKWHVEEVYVLSPTDFPDPFANVPPSCYIAQQVDPQRIVLFNNEENKAPSISGLLVVSRLIDPTFKERHYFTTYQTRLTKEAYEYWRKVDVVANQTGSIFDAPPARVRGNITSVENSAEEVHGYFQAVNQSFHRFFLLPDDLPYGMPIHCEYRPEREYFDYPSECLNCRTVRNSSYNRPSWF